MAEKVAIIDSDAMSSGIALIVVEAGFQINLTDTRWRLAESGMAHIQKFFRNEVQKGNFNPPACEER